MNNKENINTGLAPEIAVYKLPMNYREQIRQSQHSTNVIVVKVPIERQDFIEFGEGFLVEIKRRRSQV